MNPDVYPVKLSMGWGVPDYTSDATRATKALRREELHRRAVTRRQKAKRGGKR